MNPGPLLAAGLMSGTSLDGIDVALLRIEGSDPAALEVDLLAFAESPYEPAFREEIARSLEEGGPEEFTELHVEIGTRFARALLALLARAGIEPARVGVAGSHGQTFFHRPPDRDDSGPPGREARRGATLQLGCPATIAELTGIPVVSDFRSRDMAAGGEGAPLVPWADWVLLRRPGRGRALQNLGGMGNVTFLPREGGAPEVLAFDTGPGVALLDGVVRRATGGALAWDEGGERAARGQVREPFLRALLEDPFFAEPPPRSTGRERFGEARVEAIVRDFAPEAEAEWDDLLATLAELTARSIGEAYRAHLPFGAIDEVVLTGGGARNVALEQAIARALAPLPVRTGSEALGIDPDAREAAAFALMGWAHLRGLPASLPRVTGAAGPRVLGSLTPGGPR